MTLVETVKQRFHDDYPMIQLFSNLQLDSKRGEGGERADLVALTSSGVYLFLCLDEAGMLYGSDQTGQWKIKHEDGSTVFLKDPVKRNRLHAELLAKKARGIGDSVIPVILYGDQTWIVDVHVQPEVRFSGVDLFFSEFALAQQKPDLIPPAQRDVFAKQLKMLQMLSK